VTIPIHPEILPYLTQRVPENHPAAYVFVHAKTGRHFNKNTLQKEWNRVRTIMNIDKSLRLYDATRHSFASQLVNAGTSIFKVSKLLGHSSVKMTEKYSHSNIENLRADMEKISLKVVCRLSDKKMDIKAGVK
jgi:site-specific recombinase XerD